MTEIVNYQQIRSSLELILEAKVNEQTKQEILDNLDDATANNSDQLVLE